MGFTIQILGSSSATPTASRHPSAQVVQLFHDLFLVDCGEGTQMQFRRFRIRYQRINHIFISHLHGDHYLGLAGLIFTLHLFGRTEPLHVYGNPELEEILNLQLKVSETTLLFPLIFHPLIPEEDSVIFENGQVVVTAFPLCHRVPTHGFLFREKPAGRRIRKEAALPLNLSAAAYAQLREGKDIVGPSGETIPNSRLTYPPREPKSYAYCSDTGVSEVYLPFIRNVDLLYHEATFMKDKEANAREKYHSTTVDAALVAKEVRAKRLIIGHYSARYDELQPVLDESLAVFPQTELAEEGAVFNV